MISLETGEAQSVNNDLDPGKTFQIDKAIGDVSADQFDGLVIPGGSVGADKLRASKDVLGVYPDEILHAQKHLVGLLAWGRDHLADERSRVALSHEDCGAPVRAVLRSLLTRRTAPPPPGGRRSARAPRP